MITCNDSGEYTCHDCGHRWRARRRYLWWPIRLHWSRASAWGRHGREVGHDGIEQHVLGQTLSIGRLRIVLGPKPEGR